MNLYQTVLMGGLALPGAHVGTGSVASMVAPKLSTVLEKLPLVRAVALVKLSFAGGSELTVKSAPFDGPPPGAGFTTRSEEHTSELQSQSNLVCRLLLEKKK